MEIGQKLKLIKVDKILMKKKTKSRWASTMEIFRQKVKFPEKEMRDDFEMFVDIFPDHQWSLN
jgi:hypothetical protein